MQSDLQQGCMSKLAPLGAVTQEYEQYFPFRLHCLLATLEADGLDHVASFQSHGKAIKVHDTKRFETEILPKWFQLSKYASFIRQLNLYGFRRITQGPDKGGYYHKLFVRGQPSLCQNLRRTRDKKGCDPRMREEKGEEPDFYVETPVRTANHRRAGDEASGFFPQSERENIRAPVPVAPCKSPARVSRLLHPACAAAVEPAVPLPGPSLRLREESAWISSMVRDGFPRHTDMWGPRLPPSTNVDPVNAALATLLSRPTAAAPAASIERRAVPALAGIGGVSFRAAGHDLFSTMLHRAAQLELELQVERQRSRAVSQALLRPSTRASDLKLSGEAATLPGWPSFDALLLLQQQHRRSQAAVPQMPPLSSHSRSTMTQKSFDSAPQPRER